MRAMSMGRHEDRQSPMWIAGADLARSPGHRFYERLNELLAEAKFDGRAEKICASYFEADDKPGRPSIPPCTRSSSLTHSPREVRSAEAATILTQGVCANGRSMIRPANYPWDRWVNEPVVRWGAGSSECGLIGSSGGTAGRLG